MNQRCSRGCMCVLVLVGARRRGGAAADGERGRAAWRHGACLPGHCRSPHAAARRGPQPPEGSLCPRPAHAPKQPHAGGGLLAMKVSTSHQPPFNLSFSSCRVLACGRGRQANTAVGSSQMGERMGCEPGARRRSTGAHPLRPTAVGCTMQGGSHAMVPRYYSYQLLLSSHLGEGAGVGLVLLAAQVGVPGRLAAGARDPQAALRREGGRAGERAGSGRRMGAHTATRTGAPPCGRTAARPAGSMRMTCSMRATRSRKSR